MPDRPARVVVTGAGLVTALGSDAASTWASLAAGRSAVATLEPLVGWSAERPVAARVPQLQPPPSLRAPKLAKFMGRASCCALRAMGEAVTAAGRSVSRADPYRFALFAGSGETGLEYEEFFPALDAAWAGGRVGDYGPVGGPAARLVPPYFSLRSLANGPLALAAIELGMRGAGLNFVQGATASAHALAAAVDALREGRADCALVLGCDALVSPAPWLAHRRAGVLAQGAPPRACAPFDSARDGFALGEAGAALVLERDADARGRGARILGEITGLGFSTVPGGAPSRGDQHAGALRAACDTASGGHADERAWAGVLAFGDPTIDGGRTETAQLDALVGGRVPVTALTGATGFVGAATSLLQVAIALHALEHGWLPPVAGLVSPDAAGLDVVRGAARPLPAPGDVVCLSRSFSGEYAAVKVRPPRP